MKMAYFTRGDKYLRPISARQKKKYQLLTSAVSCSRLSGVQSLLHQTDNGGSSQVDGVLCILGIDSRYNTGTKRLLNYLLFGYCDFRADTLGLRITDEDLEDVVIFIKRHSVHVYCNPLNYEYLLPLIAHWRNLHIHCVSGAEYEDDEKAEEFKIKTVINMVQGCKVVGIPYGEGGGTQHKPFDPFTIETWPVIQAFALEGMGGGGFFTMNYQVVDVSQDLENNFFCAVDSVNMEILLTQTLPLFERNWGSMLSAVDLESSNGLKDLSAKSIGESIQSYFIHGQQSSASKGNSRPFHRRPYALVGKHSSHDNILKASQEGNVSSDSLVSNSGVNGTSALHMVCQAVEPRGGLACSRTYFFANGFSPVLPDQYSSSNMSVSQDLRLVMNLYFLAIDGVFEAIDVFVKTHSLKQSKTALLGVLKKGLEDKHLGVNPAFLSSQVDFTIEAFDHVGRNLPLEEGKPLPVFKMASVNLYDIPSIEHSGQSLGSVVFGESFIDSCVKVINSDGSSCMNSEYVILTQNIPRFVSWQDCDGIERSIGGKIEAFLEDKTLESKFGSHLGNGDSVHFTSTSPYMSWLEGSVDVFEHGLVFHHSRCGYIVLPKNQLTQIKMYDQDSTSVPALFLLNYKPTLQQNLPEYLHCKDHKLLLAFPPKSKAHRFLYTEVLTSWTKEQPEGVPLLESSSDLDECLKAKYEHLQVLEGISSESKVLDAIHKLAHLQEYLSHLRVSSSHRHVPVRADELSVLLGQKESTETSSENIEIVVSVITGLPGSGKEILCTSLLSLAKEHNRWIVLRRALNEFEPFNPKKLQSSLSSTLANHKKMHARLTAGNKKLRVIVVTPGFTDVKDVCESILNHPDPAVNQQIHIGAVTCCVDPRNTFITHRLVLPKLLDQCAQGWVNNVVFTSCLDPLNEQLALLQQLVRASNPDAAHILAKGGEVTRNADVDMIMSEDSFDKPTMVQQRHLICPGWSLGVHSSGEPEPPVNEICVNFYQPLDMAIFLTRLKELKSSHFLSEDEQKRGALYSIRGHVKFTDSSTLHEIEWIRLIGLICNQPVNIATVPRPPSAKNTNKSVYPNNFLIFTGFHLDENNLKDWLRHCVKPKPQKKPRKTRKDLSKKEIDDIKAKHKCDTLPEGWFYSGVQYVSFSGDKTFNHPLLEDFLEEYLQKQNENIDQHNNAIDQIPSNDLFQKL